MKKKNWRIRFNITKVAFLHLTEEALFQQPKISATTFSPSLKTALSLSELFLIK
jgi:hypothetical protein